MEIKYRTNGDICQTMCPIKKKSETGLWIRYVGSCGCSECEHFVSHDEKKQIVVCRADIAARTRRQRHKISVKFPNKRK